MQTVGLSRPFHPKGHLAGIQVKGRLQEYVICSMQLKTKPAIACDDKQHMFVPQFPLIHLADNTSLNMHGEHDGASRIVILPMVPAKRAV